MPAGESDLFVYELTAECGIGERGSSFDGVAVQARLNGQMSAAPFGGGVAILQPQDMPNGAYFV